MAMADEGKVVHHGPVGQLITGMSHVKTSPKWSIGGRKAMSARSATPGPGTYALVDPTNHKTNRTPAFGFGGGDGRNGARDFARPQSAPGPGQYSPASPNLMPNWGFGSAPRGKLVNHGTPGPGTYVAPSAQEGPMHSMAARRSPGKAHDIPGPGTYAPGAAPNLETAPKYGFSTTKRDRNINRDSPGPGTYGDLGARQAAITPTAPKHSMTPRRIVEKRESVPGPGTYRSDTNAEGRWAGPSNQLSAPSWGFGSSPRKRQPRDDNPGPGSYPVDASPVKQAPPSYSMGTRQGTQPVNANARPGPGAYSPTTDRPDTPQWAFGTDGRHRDVHSHAPGPGTYEPTVDAAFKEGRGEGPLYSIVGRKEPAEPGRTPGPGTYEAVGRPDMKDAAKWGFGTSARHKKNSGDAPGPGSYQLASKIGEGPKFSVRGRTKTGQSSTDHHAIGEHGRQYTTFGY